MAVRPSLSKGPGTRPIHPTCEPFTDAGVRVREKLGIKDKNVPLYKHEVPGLTGMGHTYGLWPPTQNRSLVAGVLAAYPWFGFRPKT